MLKRTLGHSGIEISAMGVGCWAIGGPFFLDGKADGWGKVDDNESIRAIHCAIDMGVNFFDTADAYGTGHSERVLGQAVKDKRDEVVIATKFGFTYDENTRCLTGQDASPEYIRRAFDASRRRLDTDYIDLYQLHLGSLAAEAAELAAETLEALKSEGKIRAYGWSTDETASARLWLGKPGYVAVQHDMNIFRDAAELAAFCEAHNLASINRSPLAMGFLSGKFSADSTLSADDVRGAGHEWVAYFADGRPKSEFLEKLAAIRDVLTTGGRTLVQGALAWLWARSEKTIPIPGFKTVAQVEENCAAMALGPLTPAQMQEIQTLTTAKIT